MYNKEEYPLGKISFISKRDNRDYLQLSFGAEADIYEYIEQFTCFLKACGFSFDGELTFVKGEEEIV